MAKNSNQAIEKFEFKNEEEAKGYFGKISEDIAWIVSKQDTLKSRKKSIQEELANDPRVLELKKIKGATKKLELVRKDLTGDLIGAEKFLMKDFMPGASFFEKTMASIELQLEEVRGENRLLPPKKK
jgi:hypothetical protein